MSKIACRPFAFTIVAATAIIGFFVYRSLSSTIVEVVKPTRGPAIEAVYATGTVESSIMVPIASRASARLVMFNVDEGAEVRQGQILVQLESEDMQSAFASFRAKEAFARNDFERNRELFSKGAISKHTFERSKSEWEVAKAQVNEALAQTNFMNLIAPSDGRVIRRDGEIGQPIPANQPVLWLALASQLRISAEVDEEDISKVKVNQAMAVRADAFPDSLFQAKVKSITPKGDPISRSYRVRMELTEDTPLQIGMTAETNIYAQRQPLSQMFPNAALDIRSVKPLTETRGIRGFEDVLDRLRSRPGILASPVLRLSPMLVEIVESLYME